MLAQNFQRPLLGLCLLMLTPSVVSDTAPIHIRQPTDGPLPLSLQHEVDAAIDRGRRGLIVRFESVDLAQIDASTRLLGQLALLTATDPDRVRARATLLQRMLDAPRPEADPLDAALVALQAYPTGDAPEALSVDAAASRWVEPIATQAQAFVDGLARASHASPDALATLQRLLDTGLLLGLTLPDMIPEAQHQTLRTLLRQTPAPPPPPGETAQAFRQRMNRLLPAGLLAITLGEIAADPDSAPAGFEALSAGDVITRLGGGDAEDSFRLWTLVRCYNAVPSLSRTPSAASPAQRNWRRDVARRMLGSQIIDPTDGAGFWRPPESADPARPEIDGIRLTALNLLILLSL